MGHRVRKRHPLGGLIGLGTSPIRMILSRFRANSGSGAGTPDSSALVYGWSGSLYRSLVADRSTTLPRYITATRSLMWRTTLRSWEMNRYVNWNWSCSSSKRLMIWA